MEKENSRIVLIVMLIGLVFTIPVTQMLNDTQEQVTNVSSSLWLYDVWDNSSSQNIDINFDTVYVDDIKANITGYKKQDYKYTIETNTLNLILETDIQANSNKTIYLNKTDGFSPTSDPYLAHFTGSKGDWEVTGGTFNFGSYLEADRVEAGNNYVYQQIDNIPDNTKTEYQVRCRGYYNPQYYGVGTVTDNLGKLNDMDNGFGIRFKTNKDEKALIINNSTEYLSTGLFDTRDWYYIDQFRNEDTVTTKVYYDADRTVLIANNTITQSIDDNLNYVYLYQADSRGDNWVDNRVDNFRFRECCNNNISIKVIELSDKYEVTITNTGDIDLVDTPIEIDGDKINVTSSTDSYHITDDREPVRTVTLNTNKTSTDFNFQYGGTEDKIIQIGGNISSINFTTDIDFDYLLDITYIKERIKKPLEHNVIN